MCDLTRPETLDNLMTDVGLVRSVSRQARLILAANKCDLIDERQLMTEQIEAMANNLNVPFFLTSAKTGNEVEMIFRMLGQHGGGIKASL